MQHHIRCSVCGEGHLEPRVVAEHDVGGLVGLPRVEVRDLPALVCTRCNATTVEGQVLDKLMVMLTSSIVAGSFELGPPEAKYLREQLGLTQAELGERLGISRATVARWEANEEGNVVDRASAYALRALVAFHLIENEPDLIDPKVLAAAFTHPPRPSPVRRRYVLGADGNQLSPG